MTWNRSAVALLAMVVSACSALTSFGDYRFDRDAARDAAVADAGPFDARAPDVLAPEAASGDGFAPDAGPDGDGADPDAACGVLAPACFIEGVCRPAGEANPLQPCQVCNPGLDPAGWSVAFGAPCADDGDACTTDACDAAGCTHTLATGAGCDDSDFCTMGDVCGSDGACRGMPRNCSDSLECTIDGCASDFSACTHRVMAGACLIDGDCYTAGGTSTTNPCQQCDSADPTHWSAVAENLPCSTDGVTVGFCCGGVCTPSDIFNCSGCGSRCVGGEICCPLGPCCATLASCATGC